MGIRGPIAEPNSVKWLRGNPGKRRLTAPTFPGDPNLDPASMPPPDWLFEEAKEEWRRVVPMLCRAGILLPLDGRLVAIYCNTHAMWVKANERIIREGSVVTDKHGEMRSHPAVREARQLLTLSLKLEQELGMTPASRRRLNIPGPPPIKKEPVDKKRFVFPDER